MAGDSNRSAFGVVLAVAFVCAALVSTSVVLLRPIQLNNALLERSRNILQLTGWETTAGDDTATLAQFRQLDARAVDLDTGAFDNGLDPYTFDQRRAAARESDSTPIAPEQDLARLGRRSQHAVVYLVWNGDELQRIILPIHGAGMWSMLYGFIALEGDLNTIAAATFYEQAETPGLGDVITHESWLSKWEGRKVYDPEGEPAFRVGPGRIDPASAPGRHGVDALTGATITSDAVTNLVRYWLGPHGFQPLLQNLAEQPAQPATPAQTEEGNP
jgi:Na+-transporting NADH:ubiquinone oxidoreductase subunit C